ncbi:unnamed protein product [Phyllotreta striolata]|uniref:Androgen-dependent TFPI-regulating protein n=1 Tax=Phyllotreta striolata TaxID=444603 RepID=A0A9N9XJ41_PHYSR|nr:unnamed protein product [Phyllotreta striolata]
MSGYLSIASYICVLFFNLYSLLFFIELAKDMVKSGRDKNYNQEIHKMGTHRFGYFTLWNFIFQMVFMIVAIIDESLKHLNVSKRKQQLLHKIRAEMYNVVLFPSSLMVATIFWSLFYMDRELVFPKVLDEFFPWWLNHMLHSFILLPVIIELLLPKEHHFVKFEKAVPILVFLFGLYTTMYFSIYFRHEVWLYPVYKIMTWPQRGLFTLGQFILALCYQKIGIELQNCKRKDKSKLR